MGAVMAVDVAAILCPEFVDRKCRCEMVEAEKYVGAKIFCNPHSLDSQTRTRFK